MNDKEYAKVNERIDNNIARAVPRMPLLQAREKTHGDFSEVSALSQQLKQVIHGSKAYLHDRVTLQHKEALELIAMKMARILNGDPFEPDHWDDIVGYAKLGKEAKPRL